MLNEITKAFNDKSSKAINGLNDELKKIRTGRASASILDDVKVDYYGTPTPISQVATISVPEARTILIQPWEKPMIPDVEKAILKAELGFNPSSDGDAVRINIPPLTEETRKGLVKDAKQVAEQSKIQIRNIRRDSNEALKKAKKASEITEDEEKKGLDSIQKLTDAKIDEVTKILEAKEKEILAI